MGLWPPGSLKGCQKKGKKKKKKERKGKEKEEKSKKTEKINQQDKRGAIQAQSRAPGKKTLGAPNCWRADGGCEGAKINGSLAGPPDLRPPGYAPD